MRNRNPKNLEERIQEHTEYITETPMPDKQKKTFLEVGSGKGLFLNTLAVRNLDYDFIGIEGQRGALLRCIEKAADLALTNICFYPRFIKDVRDIFENDSLSGIYLNFSDPWPKDRHEKRRLTNRRFQEGYHRVLNSSGFIEFKTDNDALFEFSTAEFNEAPFFEITEVTRDLHNSPYDKNNIKTEYEERFSMQNKNINYLRAVKVT